MIYILSDKELVGCTTLNLIEFEYKKVDIDYTNYDTIIFTSKNGVKAVDNMSQEWKTKEILSIGSGTTKYINSLGKSISYEAKKFYGDTFGYEILDIVKNKRVLYPRAKKVVSNLVDTLKENSIDIDDIVVYETKCSTNNLKLEKESIFIFSSPSTIECFFKNYTWDSSYTAVAIGAKTAKYFPKDIHIYISNIQTIEGSVEFAKNLINA
jgi:uroporphyrinogen-III synthase